jgi:hypothetical protein
MCKTDERTHKHHIIPRYMGGSNSKDNLVEVTVTQHVMFHFCNYQLWGNEEDRLAWRALSGLITPDEASLEAMTLGGKKGGKKGGKISGEKHKENKTGVCGQSPEKMRENGKKGGKITGNKSKENKTGIFGLSPEEKSEAGKKGGNKNKENKTGIFGRSPEKMSEDSKKAGKTTSSQKWQCTETGYASHAAGLTRYQNKRGIDTSKRIKVDGPRGWKITFEDGRVIVITIPLKVWAEENGYSYDCLLDVRRGKTKNHKGTIKVVCL